MTISNALQQTLEYYLFDNILSTGLIGYRRIFPRYRDNSVFTKFLEVTFCEGQCFLPCIETNKAISVLREFLHSDLNSIKITYPLYIESTINKRTADSIIQALYKCSSNYRLTNVKSSKGLNYYGGHGLAFDGNWNPYMMCGFIININKSNGSIAVVKPVCYVSPLVFESNDILAKAIIKKIIPYISKRGIGVPNTIRRGLGYSLQSFFETPVTVCDLKKYFISPVQPLKANEFNENIWEFLNCNRDDLV